MSRPEAIIVLVGPHGAGKSTLGARLGASLGCPFHGEIGRELAEDPAWRPADAWAGTPQGAFDAEVFRREALRDAEEHPLRIVESWHFGNLAYAERRSPWVVERWFEAVRAIVRERTVLVQPVSATARVLALRQSEPGDALFFHEVGAAAADWGQRLGGRVLPTVVTDAVGPEALVTELDSTLRRFLWNACR